MCMKFRLYRLTFGYREISTSCYLADSGDGYDNAEIAPLRGSNLLFTHTGVLALITEG